MKRRTRQVSRPGSNAKKMQRERRGQPPAVIETDRLVEEVREANRHIANPAERKRMIPSKPC